MRSEVVHHADHEERESVPGGVEVERALSPFRASAVLVLVAAVSLAPLFVLRGCGPPPVREVAGLAVRLAPAFPALTFTRPTFLTHAPGDAGRLFVLEQRGVIHVFANRPEVRTTAVFLDLTGRVSAAGPEEGLQGLAFHPRFRENGVLFVRYSVARPRREVVARFRVDRGRPDRVRPGPEAVLLEVRRSSGHHPGGMLAFGPDGLLYVGLGDGGGGSDARGQAQNLGTLPGAILRLDVDPPEAGQAYAIPAGNPFVDRPGARGEIWAYGLRNPRRFSFDRETGRLWAGDGGGSAPDEVDVIEKGGNYGWPVFAGRHRRDAAFGGDVSGMILPVAEVPAGAGRSITGGYVYRGRNVPDLRGCYVFADRESGRVWVINADDPGLGVPGELLATGLEISSFGEDAAGEVYACAYQQGRIYRFETRSDRR